MGKFDEIHRMFEEARGLDPPARAAFVRGLKDGALREELAALLASDSAMEEAGFLAVRTEVATEGLPGAGAQFGPFRIVRELGRGGMGAVFLAEDSRRGQPVAIKVLHPLLWTSEESRRELLHEADMARRVEHEAVVALLDQVEVEGRTVLVYEYIDGDSLSEEIERFHRGQRDGRWRVREDAIRDLLPVIDALEQAHEQGIWHRDVKPSNILLADGSHAYLTDLGLAKDSVNTDVTRSGIFKGSFRYMSPEQARARLRLVDNRSDIFSMGLVLFEALSGEHAYASEASDQELIERIAHGQARYLHEAWSDAPVALSAICYRALRPQREDRYPSIGRMGADLRAVLEDRPVSVRMPNWKDRLAERVSNHRTRLSLGVMAALIVMMALVALTREKGPPTVRVLVESNAPGHVVFVQDQDSRAGRYVSLRRLGTTPVEKSLPEGAYRFTVIAPDGAFAELCRVVHVDAHADREAQIRFVANPVPVEAVIDGMVRIEPGPFLAGIEEFEDPEDPYRTESIDDAYWIDAHEVTNGEYAAFVQATGARAPEYFALADPDSIARLPVVSINWSQAVEYAEWAGKRLPTALEWERAARGTDGRGQPWGEVVTDPELVRQWTNVDQAPLQSTYNADSRVYLRSAAPVGTHPRDRSPDGLYDVLGNVAEFVEDLPSLSNDGVMSSSDHDRRWRGSTWKVPALGARIFIMGTLPEGDRGRNDMVGFRCAKSAAPASDRAGQQ